MLGRDMKLVFTVLVLSCYSVAAIAAEYELADPGIAVVGDVGYVTIDGSDNFSAMARRHGLGFEEMRLANPGMDPWLPLDGAVITLPTRHLLPASARKGIVINVAEYRLYYFDDVADSSAKVSTFPISIGRQEWLTPVGTSKVVQKRKKPTWFPPKSVIAEHAERGDFLASSVPPGPDNPLGEYSLRLSSPSYLIHGTNRPAGVGMQVTHGCVRMYPENIEWLFPQVGVGTPVIIVNQPYKFAYIGDDLFFQAYPPLEPSEDLAARSLTRVMEVFVQVVDPQSTEVDWDLIEQTHQRPTGLPVRVGQRVVPKLVVVAAEQS
jgi:L,D-transpeptidase ErfK/SrfK